MTYHVLRPCIWSWILLWIFFGEFGHAAFEYGGLGYADGAGQIKVVGRPTLDRLAFQPALIRTGEEAGLELVHQRPFNGLDLNALSIRMRSGFRGRPLILGVTTFGDAVYQEHSLLLGTSVPLVEKVTAGIRLDIQGVRATDGYAKSAAGVSLGLLLELNERLWLGTCLNPVWNTGAGDLIPQKFHLGISFRPEEIQFLAALEHQPGLPMELKLGIERRIGRWLIWSGGYQMESQRFSAALEIKWQAFSLQYIWVDSQGLPMSYALGFGVVFP